MSSSSTAVAPQGIRCRQLECVKRETPGSPFKKCSRCGRAKYCSKECQKKDWRIHKLTCKDKNAKNGERLDEAEYNDDHVSSCMLDRVAMHASPFAMFNHSKSGRGFVFVQSVNDLADFRYTTSKGKGMKQLNRVISVHYLTMEEFEQDVCAAIPPLLKIKDSVQQAVASYKPAEEVVSVVMAGCGYMKCLSMPLCPNPETCKQMVEEQKQTFETAGMLEINVDQE